MSFRPWWKRSRSSPADFGPYRKPTAALWGRCFLSQPSQPTDHTDRHRFHRGTAGLNRKERKDRPWQRCAKPPQSRVGQVWIERFLTVVDPSFGSGLLGRPWRPSVARSAWSESRTGRIATTLITRAAASWRTGRNAHDAFAVDCPAWSLCGAVGVAVRFCLHNAMPGTSRWTLFFRVRLRLRFRNNQE